MSDRVSRIMTPHAANWYAGEDPWQTIYGLPLRLAESARRFDASPTWFSALGAGLTLPPMLAELSRRSDESTRGTALAYFSVAFALGMIVGASGGGLLYPFLGFQGLLQAGAVLCGFGVVALLRDRVTMRLAVPAY